MRDFSTKARCSNRRRFETILSSGVHETIAPRRKSVSHLVSLSRVQSHKSRKKTSEEARPVRVSEYIKCSKLSNFDHARKLGTATLARSLASRCLRFEIGGCHAVCCSRTGACSGSSVGRRDFTRVISHASSPRSS